MSTNSQKRTSGINKKSTELTPIYLVYFPKDSPVSRRLSWNLEMNIMCIRNPDCFVRIGNIVEATASTIGVGLVGSAIGAATVATYGAIAANSGEAIVAGAIVGGVIGIGKGAADAVEEHNGKIADCLRSKGYQIVATLQ
jgi:hypothetical protein